MKRTIVAAMTTSVMLASPVFAGWPGDPAKCKTDAVKVGSVCLDKYEASVWEVPATNLAGKSNAGLIKKIQNGVVKLTDLTAGNATQRGVGGTDDYPCNDNGQDCNGKIYAVSVAGVPPSANITWFQAQEACTNARKRLPSNAEWQAGVNGTPDPGPDNGTTDCNTNSAFSAVNTGSRSSCVSARGAFDMVGNVFEWVADWVPRSTGCGTWSGSTDFQCLAGAATTGEPGALIRGGSFDSGADAGPLAVGGVFEPSYSSPFGLRCAR